VKAHHGNTIDSAVLGTEGGKEQDMLSMLNKSSCNGLHGDERVVLSVELERLGSFGAGQVVVEARRLRVSPTLLCYASR